MEEDRYVLVLVEDAAGRKAVEEYATIVHSASSRLHVFRLGVATHIELARLPGVVAAEKTAFPADIARRLDQKEALFAAAFAARSTAKERVGNGLPWDATGFEPPDSTDDATGSQSTGRKKQ